MTHLSSAKRAARVSTSVLGSIAAAPVACRGRRLFHESTKVKAVEAVAAQTRRVQPPPLAPVQPTKAAVQGTPVQETPVQGTGPLNILAQSHKPEFYRAVSKIMELRQKYIRDRTIFVEAKDMMPLLLGLGAKHEDLALLLQVSDRLYSDPTLPYRLSRNSRFCIDFDRKTLSRLEFQPFTLSAEEDFQRYDSGQRRHFDEVQNDLQLNSVFQALFLFKAMIMNGVSTTHRPKLNYDTNKWVCTLFNVRTFTNSEVLGEPALEGVHADGVDHTMTTFLGSRNMAPNSAATFMHDMAETTGIRIEEASLHNLVGRVQHRDFLDTLMVVDHERKHSLSPVYPIDKTKEASRDMLIFFTRKPAEKTHVSGAIDSFNLHKSLPMEISIFAPDAQ